MTRGDAIAGLIVCGLVVGAFLWGIVLDLRYRRPRRRGVVNMPARRYEYDPKAEMEAIVDMGDLLTDEALERLRRADEERLLG